MLRQKSNFSFCDEILVQEIAYWETEKESQYYKFIIVYQWLIKLCCYPSAPGPRTYKDNRTTQMYSIPMIEITVSVISWHGMQKVVHLQHHFPWYLYEASNFNGVNKIRSLLMHIILNKRIQTPKNLQERKKK